VLLAYTLIHVTVFFYYSNLSVYMFEVVVLFVLAIAAWYAVRFFSNRKIANQSTCSNKLKVQRIPYLDGISTHLQSEIESPYLHVQPILFYSDITIRWLLLN